MIWNEQRNLHAGTNPSPMPNTKYRKQSPALLSGSNVRIMNKTHTNVKKTGRESAIKRQMKENKIERRRIMQILEQEYKHQQKYNEFQKSVLSTSYDQNCI